MIRDELEKCVGLVKKAGSDGVNGRRVVNLLKAFIVFFCKKNYFN